MTNRCLVAFFFMLFDHESECKVGASMTERVPTLLTQHAAAVATSGWVQAEQIANSLLQLEPEQSLHYKRRGDARERQRNFDGALKDYETAIAISSTDPKKA